MSDCPKCNGVRWKHEAAWRMDIPCPLCNADERLPWDRSRIQREALPVPFGDEVTSFLLQLLSAAAASVRFGAMVDWDMEGPLAARLRHEAQDVRRRAAWPFLYGFAED